MAATDGAAVLHVELVTPDGPVFVDEARMVVVPGADGELGVLARHAPLVARLSPGETRIRASADDEWVSFATGSGYFKVQADTALVLVSSAERADAIDIGAAERARDEAQGRIDAALAAGQDEESVELRGARRDLADAENRLAVARRA